MRNSISREQLIKWMEQEGEHVDAKEFCKKYKIGIAKVYEQFESFTELKNLTGKKNKAKKKDISDEEMLNRIRAFYKENNRIPFYAEIKGAQILAERFGNFTTAIEKALNINIKIEPVTEKECIEHYNQLKAQLNRVPTKEEFLNSRIILGDLHKIFGGWRMFKRKMKDEHPGSIPKISDKDVIEEYLKISKLVEKPYGATKEDFNKYSKYSTAVLKRFGGMNDLRTMCNLETVGRKSKNYTIEELIENLTIAYKEKGRRLTITEIKKDKNLPSPITIFSFFKTTNLADVWKKIERNVDAKKYVIRPAKINGVWRNVKCYEDYIFFKNEKYFLEDSEIVVKNEKDKIYIDNKVYKKN